jgi:GT2 family glycosyltransferase
MTRLTVSIVNWNTRDALRRCLQSLRSGLDGLDSEVVVVDNGSTDGSADMVANEFPDVRLIRAARNLGFAGGNNLPLEHTTADYVLILNPDVEVSADTVVRLIEFLERTPDAAAASPALAGEDGTVQAHLYRRFPTFSQIALFWTVLGPLARSFPPLRRAVFEHDIRGRSPIAVDQLPGAAMMMRGSALRSVGMLDPGYFVWWEDVDWSFRARRAGFSLHVLPNLTCRHTGGASFAAWSVETRVFQFYRAFYRFLARHRLYRLARRTLPVIMVDLTLKDVLLRLRGTGAGEGLTPTKTEIRRIVNMMARDVVPDFDNAHPSASPVAHQDEPRHRLQAEAESHEAVDVIIVNWNGRRFLPRCIEALSRSTVAVHVVLVDNASTDGSVEYLRSAHPELTLIETGSNGGYAAGSNIGLRATHAPYAFVMNPDVLVEPDHLEILRDCLAGAGGIGIAQGKLFSISTDDFLAATPTRATLDSAGHVIRRSRMVVDRGQGEPDGPLYDREASVFSACGAALFLRRAMLDDLAPDGGYFSESFFAYKEDIDLSWRARLLGWDVRYVPDAVAHHVRAVPLKAGAWRDMAPAARRHSWKNHYLLMMRNDRAIDLLRALPFIAAWELLRLGHALLRDRRVLPAYGEAAREIRSALRARRDILRRRRAAADDIRQWFGGEAIPARDRESAVSEVAA